MIAKANSKEKRNKKKNKQRKKEKKRVDSQYSLSALQQQREQKQPDQAQAP